MTNNGKNGSLVIKPDFTVELRNIDDSKYAETLFAEAIRLKKADERDFERFIGELAGLLKKAIEVRSGGESTSVKEETAQKMTSSILYVIGAALKQAPSPEHALLRLVSESAAKIYDDGLILLNRLRSQADLLRLLLVRTKKTDQSDDYYSFIDIVAKKYVGTYEPKFDAAKSVWARVPEIETDRNVYGMLEFYKVMCRLYEYNQS